MIPLPDFKRCVRCGHKMPLDVVHFRAHKRPGGRVSWDCRSCANKAAREAEARALADPLRGPQYRARRAAWAVEHRQRNRARYAAATARYYERMMATPEGRAEVIVSKRLSRRLAAERDGRAQVIPKRPTVEPYREVAHGKGSDTVPAAPLVRYLRKTYPGWNPGELGQHVNKAVSPRLIYRLLVEGAANVEIDAVDRLCTIGLGRPDLVNALYPMES